MVLEWGSVEDPASPGRKAQWMRDTSSLLALPAYRQFRALLHWDDRTTGMLARTTCGFDYRTSAAAMSAWRSMATSPALTAASPCDTGACIATGKPARRPARSRLPLVAGGLPVAVLVAGFVGFEVHRRRKAVRP